MKRHISAQEGGTPTFVPTGYRKPSVTLMKCDEWNKSLYRIEKCIEWWIVWRWLAMLREIVERALLGWCNVPSRIADAEQDSSCGNKKSHEPQRAKREITKTYCALQNSAGQVFYRNPIEQLFLPNRFAYLNRPEQAHGIFEPHQGRI